VGTGAVQVVGALLAVGMTALGVVAVRDALVAGGAVSGQPWLLGTLGRLDGTRPAAWALALGAALVLLGLWLARTALARRPSTGLALRARTGVFVDPRDVSRLAVSVAEDVDGVLHASGRCRRRRLAVAVRTTGDASTPDAVREALATRLAAFDPPLAVRVTARPEGNR